MSFHLSSDAGRAHELYSWLFRQPNQVSLLNIPVFACYAAVTHMTEGLITDCGVYRI